MGNDLTRRAGRRKGAEASNLGLKLRHARLTRGSSLRALADEIGCSSSFLSKIENDHKRPSFATLHRLVRALQINVAALFTDHQIRTGPIALFRKGTRPLIALDSDRKGRGIRLERLIPGSLSALLEANIHEVSPGASSRGFISHKGEEMGYVLEGRLELTVEKTTVTVMAGDVFFFSSERRHGYRNAGKRITRILWVNTPPSF
jgi:transcriptional regulator with XRE-family HTH domain